LSQTFADFFSKGWADHATDAAVVAARLPDALPLLSHPDEIAQLANLATHVVGEHLARWSDGIAFLDKLVSSPAFAAGSEAERAINRLRATLELSGGIRNEITKFPLSDQIRILAVAAAALSAQKNGGEAAKLFESSLALATGLAKDDPANRALAVAGNNLSAELEALLARTSEETALMILAAQTGRKYWEHAGAWTQVMFAEHRLASSYLTAGKLDEALRHAELCEALALKNSADASTLFWPYELLARVQAAHKREPERAGAAAKALELFEQMSGDDQAWCRPTLDKLGA
jgi:tetratricopeptide (TPR) repeat protein